MNLKRIEFHKKNVHLIYTGNVKAIVPKEFLNVTISQQLKPFIYNDMKKGIKKL